MCWPIVAVPEFHGSVRLYTDFRKQNALTVPDPFQMSWMEALTDRVGWAKSVIKLVMIRGLWQIPLGMEWIPLTGLVTPHGHYQCKFVNFGLRNAPGTFSRLTSKVLHGFNKFSDACFADVTITLVNT